MKNESEKDIYIDTRQGKMHADLNLPVTGTGCYVTVVGGKGTAQNILIVSLKLQKLLPRGGLEHLQSTQQKYFSVQKQPDNTRPEGSRPTAGRRWIFTRSVLLAPQEAILLPSLEKQAW